MPASRTNSPGRKTAILAVVKADGYGHGMEMVARALYDDGLVKDFAVANVAEAIRLRESLPGVPVTIPVAGPVRRTPEIVRYGFLPWVSSISEAEDYARLSLALRDNNNSGRPFDLVINVDTGMGREGVLPDGLDALSRMIANTPGILLRGVVTHLPSPDEDTAFTVAQLAGFERLLAGVPPAAQRHAQNSAGLLSKVLDPASHPVHFADLTDLAAVERRLKSSPAIRLIMVSPSSSSSSSPRHSARTTWTAVSHPLLPPLPLSPPSTAVGESNESSDEVRSARPSVPHSVSSSPLRDSSGLILRIRLSFCCFCLLPLPGLWT